MRELIYNFYAKKALKRAKRTVEESKKYLKKYENMSDEEIRNEYLKIREDISKISKNYTEHRKYLPELLAMIRVASERSLGLKPFDVQLMGAVILDEGRIAEMKTGEGKTLTASIAAIINAVYKKPIHIVTVNDYLAKRDSETMRPLYNFFGLNTGVIYSDQPDFEKQMMYNEPVVYATNTEIGFDYLRDNLVTSYDMKVFKGERFFCIIDEVDSILIDEARTPLIISDKQMTEEGKQMYILADLLAKEMKRGIDYEVDEKHKNVFLTEEGILKAEKKIGIDNLYENKKGILFVHRLNNAIYAKELLKKDKDYTLIKNPKTGRIEVVLIDEFTGRLAIGKSLSDGLHQAIEAKEGVEITPENKTIAKITYPNFFSLYKKVSGMTGTAVSQREEFMEVYHLEVVPVPTNRPVIRKDNKDYVYATSDIRDREVVKLIKELHKKGQPVLVGTRNVETSERISALLKKEGIKHEVLNAKNHEKEAEIIAKAGQKGAVTISTNMAGRGTDIKLDEEARKLGGLYVIGVERNENRRIDDQLIGRSGRQGDPGESRFFLSLEDSLLKIFADKHVKALYNSFKEKGAIESALLTKAIKKAQKNIEGVHSEIRKNLLRFDNVLDKQRRMFYKMRDDILLAKKEDFIKKIESYIEEMSEDEISSEERKKIKEVLEFIKEHEEEINVEEFFRNIFIRIMDEEFLDFLNTLEILREGIHLRGFSQKEPLIEYKKESYILFQGFIFNTKKRILKELAEINLEQVLERINANMFYEENSNMFIKDLIGKRVDEIVSDNNFNVNKLAIQHNEKKENPLAKVKRLKFDF